MDCSREVYIRLMDIMASRRREALRPSTRRLQEAHWRAYSLFIERFTLQSHETEADTVCIFLETLAQRDLQPSTVRSYLSSIRSIAKRAGLKTEDLYSIGVSDWISGYEKTFVRDYKHLPVISIIDLNKIIIIAQDSELQLFIIALATAAFFTLLRASNLMPKETFDKTRDLQRRHVTFDNDQMIIQLPWTKTKQTRSLTTITVVATNSPVCPVTAMRNFLGAYPAPPDAPLFTMNDTYYSAKEGRVILKQIHREAGIDPCARFHAYRRGGARFYFENNMPLEAIKRMGTWRSDAILLYLRDSVPPTDDLINTIQHARAKGRI